MDRPTGIVIVLLAAGASTRMGGRDKLLEPLADGRPILRHVAERACATGAPVIAVLPPDRPMRVAALAELSLTQVQADNARLGMSASLSAGLAAAAGAAGAMILPCDMPDLAADDLRAMIASFAADTGQILRATDADGRPGHPVILPADLWPEAMTLDGDTGARPVLRRHAGRLRLMPLRGHSATTDLDTPEDWAAWRASRSQQ